MSKNETKILPVYHYILIMPLMVCFGDNNYIVTKIYHPRVCWYFFFISVCFCPKLNALIDNHANIYLHPTITIYSVSNLNFLVDF